MAIKIEEGQSIYPAVNFVNAQRDAAGIALIFGTEVEGKSADLIVRLSNEQWETLKTLVKGAGV
jgi:hypothetical protein